MGPLTSLEGDTCTAGSVEHGEGDAAECGVDPLQCLLWFLCNECNALNFDFYTKS